MEKNMKKLSKKLMTVNVSSNLNQQTVLPLYLFLYRNVRRENGKRAKVLSIRSVFERLKNLNPFLFDYKNDFPPSSLKFASEHQLHLVNKSTVFPIECNGISKLN